MQFKILFLSFSEVELRSIHFLQNIVYNLRSKSNVNIKLRKNRNHYHQSLNNESKQKKNTSNSFNSTPPNVDTLCQHRARLSCHILEYLCP